MKMKVKTSHVGSLPRSQKVVDFIFAKEKEQAYDKLVFDQTMKEAVELTVKKQKDSGINIVSDGETSKISYATYVKDRYYGFGGDSPRNPPADLELFPKYLEKLANSGGTPKYARPMCIDKLEPKKNDDLDKDISNLTLSIKNNGIEKGFMNSASPGVISLFLQNQYYPTREAYLEALSLLMKVEYEKIVNAGLDLQIDCPDLALSRHMLFSEMTDDEFIKIASLNIEALNNALSNIPKEKIRIHICWGNYEGPHVCDISIDKMFNSLMSVKTGHILFEAANPRHAHEWEVFEDKKMSIPDDLILMPGVIDTTTNFVEHPNLVSQRLRNFTEIVGGERVIASTDCGFGTFAGFGTIDPDIAYEKLNTLSKGASNV